MPRRSKKASVRRGKIQCVEPSSGKVFADLGLPDAEELQTKLHLAYGAHRAIARLRISPAEVSQSLSLKRPQVAGLKAYRLEDFSVRALMRFLTIEPT